MKSPDIYGIGTAIESAVEIVRVCARAAGRTTLLLDLLQDGDCVVFGEQENGRQFHHACMHRGLKNIRIVISDPREYYRVHEKLRMEKGRVFFDHVWIEKYYAHAFAEAKYYLDKLHTVVNPEKEESTKEMRMYIKTNWTMEGV